MSDDTTTPEKRTRTPKPVTEVGAMLRIESIFDTFDESAQRRIAFYFAQRAGLTYAVPTNGASEAA